MLLISAGTCCGGERFKILGSKQDSVLYNGGRGWREVADRPGRSIQAELGHPRGLHNNSSITSCQGETVYRKLRNAKSGGQGTWQGKL